MAYYAHQWVQKSAVEMRKKEEVNKNKMNASVNAAFREQRGVNVDISVKFYVFAVREKVKVVRDDVVLPED